MEMPKKNYSTQAKLATAKTEESYDRHKSSVGSYFDLCPAWTGETKFKPYPKLGWL